MQISALPSKGSSSHTNSQGHGQIKITKSHPEHYYNKKYLLTIPMASNFIFFAADAPPEPAKQRGTSVHVIRASMFAAAPTLNPQQKH
jgi:hypothetical protein